MQEKKRTEGKTGKPGGNLQAGTKSKNKGKEKVKSLHFHPDKSQDRIDWKSNQPLGALGPLLKNTWPLFLALGHNFEASTRLFEGT